jgi:Na+/H+ antiporter family
MPAMRDGGQGFDACLAVPIILEEGFAVVAPVKHVIERAGILASPVLVATVGAVLAGAVSVDHCSAITDTTFVSAFSSDRDVMAHVRTQLPCALTAAFLATVLDLSAGRLRAIPLVVARDGRGCLLIPRPLPWTAGGRIRLRVTMANSIDQAGVFC